MSWLVGGGVVLALIALAVVWRRRQTEKRAYDLIMLVVAIALPEARPERIGKTMRMTRGKETAVFPLDPVMEAMVDGGLPHAVTCVGNLLDRQVDDDTRTRIVAFARERVMRERPDAKIVSESAAAFVAEHRGVRRTFETRALVQEFWGRDDEPAAEREKLMKTIVDNRFASSFDPNESARDRLRPRFVTRARRNAVLGRARAAGPTASHEWITIEVPGLRYEVDAVIDLGETTGTVTRPALASLQVADARELYEVALANLQALHAHEELPTRGLKTITGRADHAAALVLTIPARLAPGVELVAVAPTHGRLLLWPMGDLAAAKKAKRQMREIAVEGEAPIPKPVRVTSAGFVPTTFKELLAKQDDDDDEKEHAISM